MMSDEDIAEVTGGDAGFTGLSALDEKVRLVAKILG